MSNLSLKGESVGLADMLNARDNRAMIQRQLLQENSGSTLLSLTMNIPGPIKTTQEIETVFLLMVKEVEKQLTENDLISKTCRVLKTGPECYLLVRKNRIELKKGMIQLEEIHPFGRLMDLDVVYSANGQLHSISRVQLGYEPRSCLICKKDAKVCARTGQHSMEELLQATCQIIQKGKIK